MDNELNNKISEQTKILSSIDQNIKTMVGTLKLINLILIVSVGLFILSN
jgi:hypothetical protein